jgi:single-strand DNA-binding protein
MRSLNKVTLIGNLGKDPEVQTLESGTKLVKFSLATTETFKDKSGNRQDQTEWHNVIVWQKLAEIAEKYLHKGSYIYLEGRIRTRTWDDKDGKKNYRTEIVADTFMMLDRKPQGSDNNVQAPQTADVIDDAVDDLPF